MPPLRVRLTNDGNVCVPVPTFDILSATYFQAGRTADALLEQMLRNIIVNATEPERQQLLAGEFDMDRNDPQRLAPLVQEWTETDEAFLYRCIKRRVALELYPVEIRGPPELGNDEPNRGLDVETGSEPGTESENGQEDTSESEDQVAPVRRRTGLVLSGNPIEGEAINDEIGYLDGLPAPVPAVEENQESGGEEAQEILSNEVEPANGQNSGSGNAQ